MELIESLKIDEIVYENEDELEIELLFLVKCNEYQLTYMFGIFGSDLKTIENITILNSFNLK